MEVTYDYYRIFYYVAKYGSISRAASILMRGQPNISKTLKLLEKQLDCNLLVRSNRGVTLTPEGERLYQHLKIAFLHIEEAEDELRSARGLENGSISIATTEVALYCSVMYALESFRRDYPNVKVYLKISNNANSMVLLKNGAVDFAVLSMHENEYIDSSYKVKEIKEFSELLCAKSGAVNIENDDVNAILENTYIGLNNTTYTYKFCRNYLLTRGITKEPDVEVVTEGQLLQLVRAGVGIGFLAEPLADEWIKNGTIEQIKLKKMPPRRMICLVQSRKTNLSIAAKTFLNYLK